MFSQSLRRTSTSASSGGSFNDRSHERASSPDRSNTQTLHYRPDIDGLRAIAVVAVVGFHAFPKAVPGGFVGVDVFFVISGFLISAIIFKHLARSDFSLADFYLRRARRILPALCVVLATCLLFGFYVLLPDEFTNLGKHTAAAAAFVANLAFWRESGYFAPAAELQPLLHLWSLGVEEQFYLVWPLLLLLAWRRKLNLVLIISLITGASFALNLVLVDRHETANFYLPMSRFWELGLGCLLAAIQTQQRGPILPAVRFPFSTPMRAMAAQLPLVGLVLIITAVFSFDSHTTFPGIAALLPTVGTICLIAAPRGSWINEKLLAHRAVVFIGTISYSLYLWHWPIQSFAAILNSGVPSIAIRAGGVLLSFILAILTFRLVELPIRTQRRLGVSIGLGGCAVALGLLGFMVYAREGFIERFHNDVMAMREGPKQDALCMASVPQRYQFNYCRRTNLHHPEVAFLGDSQAQGIYEGAVSTLGQDKPMVLLARGGCPPLLSVQPSPGAYVSDNQRRGCNETWATFVDYIRQARPQTVVLVGDGSRFFDASVRRSDSVVSGTQEDKDAFKAGLTNLVAALQQYSRVIYVLEIPTFDSPPACLLRPIKLAGSSCSPRVTRSALEASRAGYEASVLEVQRDHAGLMVIDPIPSLCNTQSCSQISSSGQILYSDKMHLSPAGGRRLAQSSGLARFIADSTTGSGG